MVKGLNSELAIYHQILFIDSKNDISNNFSNQLIAIDDGFVAYLNQQEKDSPTNNYDNLLS